jgi:aryl-alcohol dehydrogenase-like predicted oxidoreductase
MTDTTTLARSIAGVAVHPIGLGEMPMSLAGRPDEEQSIRTIHAALDAGANLIDTPTPMRPTIATSVTASGWWPRR